MTVDEIVGLVVDGLAGFGVEVSAVDVEISVFRYLRVFALEVGRDPASRRLVRLAAFDAAVDADALDVELDEVDAAQLVERVLLSEGRRRLDLVDLVTSVGSDVLASQGFDVTGRPGGES